MGLCENCKITMCRAERDDVIGCAEFVAKNTNVLTNADRIRAMSDEALTTFLNKIVVNHHIKNADNCNHCPLKGAKPCDTAGIVDWLKQPAEENDYGSCNSI